MSICMLGRRSFFEFDEPTPSLVETLVAAVCCLRKEARQSSHNHIICVNSTQTLSWYGFIWIQFKCYSQLHPSPTIRLVIPPMGREHLSQPYDIPIVVLMRQYQHRVFFYFISYRLVRRFSEFNDIFFSQVGFIQI